jgi:hypothetical protein
MVVTLKSGTQLRMPVSSFTTGTNPRGQLARLKWAAPPEADAALNWVCLEEIAAVHAEDAAGQLGDGATP